MKRLPLLPLALALVPIAPAMAMMAMMVACDTPSGVGLPCVATANCPGELACIEGSCAPAVVLPAPDDVHERVAKPRPDAPSIDNAITPGGELPVNPDENVHPNDPDEPVTPNDPNEPDEPDAPVEPTGGWTVVAYDLPLFDKPRVVPGLPGAGAAGVEVYFLEGTIGTGATCDGLTRAFPDGSVDPLAGPTVGCFKELDAQRTGDNIVRVVMRNSFTDSSDVVFADFGPDLLNDDAFAPDAANQHRGVRARIALTPEGQPDWAWSVRSPSGPDLIEQLHAASAVPDVVAEVDDLVDDLDYVVDSEGFGAVFVTKYYAPELVLRTRNTNVLVAGDVGGAIEAMRCGGAMHVVYRKADELLVARATGPFIESRTVIASGLTSDRVRGDVAIACDEGAVWTAWTDAGAVHVAPPAGPIEIVSAGGGGISLAVVDGAPHVAFGSTAVNRQLRYATRP